MRCNRAKLFPLNGICTNVPQFEADLVKDGELLASAELCQWCVEDLYLLVLEKGSEVRIRRLEDS